MKLLTDAEIQLVHDIMKDAHDTFFQKVITWMRTHSEMDRWGENSSDNNPTPTDLLVLINWNYMRTWPTIFSTESGNIDRQTCQILMNKDYLREQQWLDSKGRFIYNEGYDKFIIDGVSYVPTGDTPVSQLGNDDLLFSIILKKEELITGE